MQPGYPSEGSGYRLLLTEDGSASLYAEEYGEAMHSLSGAYQEACLKHLLPSGLLSRKQQVLTVLDVGFGLGYNVLALLLAFQGRERGQSLRIISLEKTESYFPLMSSLRFGDERDAVYERLREGVEISRQGSEYTGENFTFSLVIGDGREYLRKASGILFDAVFQDPYSPARNPELWSLDYFRKLRSLCADEAVLTTYSSAPQIRRALFDAGFHLGRGPSVGRKKEGTIASPSPLAGELTPQEIAGLCSNPKSLPYRDEGLGETRQRILELRREEMRGKRLKTDPPARQ